jgi:DHA2 family multidrug resistance protein-like MFS transporter
VPAFSASLATYTFGIFFGFGIFLFIAQYRQLVLGLSPLQAGLWSVPGALAFVVGSNLAPRIVRRVKPAFMVVGGLLLAAVGMGMLALVGSDSLALVVIGNTLMSVGFGFTFTLTVDLVVGAAPPDRAGAASALAETGAELGGALGLAVLGSLGVAVYRHLLTSNMPPAISPEIAEVAQETLGAAVVAAGQLPGELGAGLLSTAQLAFVQALQLAQARTELRRLHQSLGSTIVYVTHDQEEAMTLGGRIAVMRDGVLEQVAPPLDVYERPANAFVARFIGAPAMNLFPPATAGLDSTAGAMAGIRPQDILLREDGPLRATVDLVEPRGHDAVVHLRVDDAAATSLMALTPIPPPAGSVVGVVLPRERLHLFDEAGVRVKG